MSSYNAPNLRNIETFNNNSNKSNKGGIIGDDDNFLTDNEKMNLLNMYNDWKFSKPYNVVGNHIGNVDIFYTYENIKFKFVLNGIQLYAAENIINGNILILKHNKDVSTINQTYKTSIKLTGEFYSIYDNDTKIIIDIFDEFTNKYYKITVLNGFINAAYTHLITGVKTYNKMVIIEKII